VIPVRHHNGHDVAVFGLARSGLAAVYALLAGGARVTAWDDKAVAREKAASAGAQIADLSQDANFERFTALVLSPGVPLTHPEPHPVVRRAQAAGVEIIGDIELFLRSLPPKGHGRPRIVAITGTNGKSTTTALIGHLLRRAGLDARVGGNIGEPVLALDPPAASSIMVLEMSSYQIDLTKSLAPDVGVLLNVTPDHLDRHGTLENYAAVKARLFEGQGAGDLAVIGIDDAHTERLYTRMACTAKTPNDNIGRPAVVPVSVGKALGRGVYVIDGVLYDSTRPPVGEVVDLRSVRGLPGSHNWQNAAAAYAAACAFVKNRGALTDAMAAFPGLAHRQEFVGLLGNVRFIHDSKATNADAAARALACYDDIFWIAGGRPKQDGIESLAPWFARMRKAYLIGEAAEAFAATLKGKVETVQCGTLDKAVEAAATDARASSLPAPVVLLSPACASFDQYDSFEERGTHFRALADMLIDRATAPTMEPAR
jgi:UDP-N-acetylmuramoylalanine--D-glutamate ligase